jgi:AcrR family transcriptional regulator
MRTREQNKKLVKDRIIHACIALLGRQEISSITSRQLATEAKISYQTLYNHYPTQAQIFADALRQSSNTLSEQLDLIVKNYDANLLASFASIDLTRLEHLNRGGKETWQFIANNLHANQQSSAYHQDSDDAALIKILDPRIYERTHWLLQTSQGMGDLQEKLDLQLLSYTLICLSDYALGRYLKFTEVNEVSVLQTSREQYGLVLSSFQTE